MCMEYKDFYPIDEHSLLIRINHLMDLWEERISFLGEDFSELFVRDGFAPYYTHQRVKILFIGKEALEIAGFDYMVDIIKKCYNENSLGGKTINQYQFHALMNYIAYGINNKIKTYTELPWASDIASNFGKPGGISFAFMNVSKFSNESGNWYADKNLIETFITASSQSDFNLFSKEIDLLEPDLIIGMNLKNWYDALGDSCDFVRNFNGCVDYYHLKTENGEYPLFDSYHFSYMVNKDTYFYTPIINAASYIGLL